VRRILNTKRVGHAGTLDPLATGVLVVMVGEATKLSGYLTLDDKSYEARVTLGVSTDTLDAEGSVTAEAQLPAWLLDEDAARRRIEEALSRERERVSQVPPAFSAIKIDGRAGYKRARAGETIELPPRDVAVRQLELRARDDAEIVLSLKVTKGYYVRALARDLGDALGLPAHLSALRRTASGAFTIDQAVMLDAVSRDALLATAQAARRVLPVAQLTASGVERAGFGQRLESDDFVDEPHACNPTAWLASDGSLVAIGTFDAGHGSVLRGFNSD
jgi:tRNA pseudouridine55 synthase